MMPWLPYPVVERGGVFVNAISLHEYHAQAGDYVEFNGVVFRITGTR